MYGNVKCVLTPIPSGWTDKDLQTLKGCPCSLLLPFRPSVKAGVSHSCLLRSKNYHRNPNRRHTLTT